MGNEDEVQTGTAAHLEGESLDETRASLGALAAEFGRVCTQARASVIIRILEQEILEWKRERRFPGYRLGASGRRATYGY